MLIYCRTTNNKKVPSFGLSSASQTEPEVDGASSSASVETLIDETENSDENQTDSASSTDEVESTFIRRLISDICSGDQQQSALVEISDEMESNDSKVGETAEGVSQLTALVENVMEEDILYQMKSFTSGEVLNSI